MKWQDLWGYQQQDYRSWPSIVENQIQVVRVKLNHHTQQVRIKFSNLYGMEDMQLERVDISLLNKEGKTKKEPQILTYKQKEIIVLSAGTSQVLSDVVNIDARPTDIIEIRTFVRNKTIVTGGIVSYARLQQEVLNYQWEKNYHVFTLDQKTLFRMVKENQRMFYIYGISGIQGFTQDDSQTIVAFGDSLTQQGFWLDHLKQRILNRFPNTSIINKGIGGGRVLQDTDPTVDSYQRHGRAGIKRYLSDTFESLNVNTVIVFHGINDILGIKPEQNEEELFNQLIEAFMFYVEEAKLRKINIFICTLLPMKGSELYSEKAEKLRKRINMWIRKNFSSDKVFDFEKVVAEKRYNEYLFFEYDCGDGLHLSTQGGKAIADSIDLKAVLHP